MKALNEILKLKKITPYIQKKASKNKGHPYWHLAKEYGDYIGLPTIFVLKLFKQFGKNKVLSLRSYLKDYPKDHRGLRGLIIWKLKNPA